jgi:hypothetical protein
MMRIETERAIYLGMCALYDITERASGRPIQPSLGLRALLAFLYEHSNGDLEPFTEFWRECQKPWIGNPQGSYMRATYSRTAWNKIAIATGFDRMDGYDQIHKALRHEKARHPHGDCGRL